MTFWEFLDWLWDRIDKVLQWFGVDYSDLYEGAKNALKWAIAEASYYFGLAKQWVLERAYAAVTWVTDNLGVIWSTISQLWQGISNAVVTAYNNVVAWANPKIQAARDFATSLFDGVKTWALDLLANLNAGLTALITDAKTSLLNLFNPLLVLKPITTLLQDLASVDTYNKIKTLVTNMFGTLTIIVTDPLGFLTGMLFPVFAEVICYAIGYGLGATQTQLPPLPKWGKGGGGPYVPPGPLPPGTGVLVHPIDPVWVSGYTFTPPTHYGVDLGLGTGQDVYAMHNGVVLESGFSAVGYGNTVLLQNETYTSRYGHLQVCLVSPGQNVQAGQLIGYGDTTGNSTGNHLHLELKISGTFVDPLLYL